MRLRLGVGVQDRALADAEAMHEAVARHLLHRGAQGRRQTFGDTLAAKAGVEHVEKAGHAVVEGLAHRSAAAISAARMRVSPGSMRNSGCHCTPRQKWWAGASMPSITPSGAVALTIAPAPGVRTAW